MRRDDDGVLARVDGHTDEPPCFHHEQWTGTDLQRDNRVQPRRQQREWEGRNVIGGGQLGIRQGELDRGSRRCLLHSRRRVERVPALGRSQQLRREPDHLAVGGGVIILCTTLYIFTAIFLSISHRLVHK